MINSKFLESQTDEVRNLYIRRKDDFDEIESIYNKPLHFITRDEYLDYWKTHKQTSLIFLVQQKNLILNYIKWVYNNTNELKKYYQDEILLEDKYHISIDDLEDALDKDLISSTVLSRDELISLLKRDECWGDRFICLALFEGIKGKHFRDLYYFDINDIHGDEVKLKSGLVLKVSKQLIYYAEKALEEPTRIITDKAGVYKEIPLKKSDRYPVRVRFDSDVEPGDARTDIQLAQFFKNRMITIRQQLNVQAFTTQSLRNSGKIDMIKRLQPDKDVYKTILDNKEEIAKRYGVDSSVKKWYLNYKGYFEK